MGEQAAEAGDHAVARHDVTTVLCAPVIAGYTTAASFRTIPEAGSEHRSDNPDARDRSFLYPHCPTHMAQTEQMVEPVDPMLGVSIFYALKVFVVHITSV